MVIPNIGGFSDAVFHVVASYLGDDANRFVAEVESVELNMAQPLKLTPLVWAIGLTRF